MEKRTSYDIDDIGQGPDSVAFSPDQSILTRMAGGLGWQVTQESGREGEVGWGEGPDQELSQNSWQLSGLLGGSVS